jgi:hypothetical protein
MKTTTKPKKVRTEDKEFAVNAAEVSVFMACFGLVNELKTIHAALHKEELSNEEFGQKFNALLSQLCYVADSTTRFDIVLPVERYGQFSSFFWRWFNWWDDYLKALPPQVIIALRMATKEANLGFLARYRPSGSWIDYRKDPPFTVVNT